MPLAVLPGDTTLVNGSAFVNVTLLTVGTQTITATDVADPTLTGTVSSDATPPVAALFDERFSTPAEAVSTPGRALTGAPRRLAAAAVAAISPLL